MFKSKCVSFIGAMFLAGTTFAAQLPDCPALDEIKARGMAVAEEVEHNVYISYTMDEYKTPYNWAFIIWPLYETSNADALRSATDVLNSLHVPGVPETEHGEVFCFYDTGKPDNYAVAVLDTMQRSPMQFKSLLKR